jgi:hypothetical protein
MDRMRTVCPSDIPIVCQIVGVEVRVAPASHLDSKHQSPPSPVGPVLRSDESVSDRIGTRATYSKTVAASHLGLYHITRILGAELCFVSIYNSLNNHWIT